MVYRCGLQEGIHDSMTTARERYEQRTKVVTFRVSLEVYGELEEIKAKGGLSYSDLIKLGAGIAQEEIKGKLGEASGLEDRLAELKASVEEEQQRLSGFVAEERQRRLEELDIEMKAFKLFDRRWRPEQVSHKLAISQATAFHYFDEWSRERGEKRAAERELLRRCLIKHLDRLKERKLWAAISPSSSEEYLRELEQEIDYCRHYLFPAPSKINKEWKEFLITEYSSKL